MPSPARDLLPWRSPTSRHHAARWRCVGARSARRRTEQSARIKVRDARGARSSYRQGTDTNPSWLTRCTKSSRKHDWQSCFVAEAWKLVAAPLGVTLPELISTPDIYLPSVVPMHRLTPPFILSPTHGPHRSVRGPPQYIARCRKRSCASKYDASRREHSP